MIFTQRLEPDINFDQLRLLSKEGRWELGIRSVLWGYRVSLMQVGNEWWTLDYCASDDMTFLNDLAIVLNLALLPFPETSTEKEIRDKFPSFEFKPINRDRCWGALVEMAFGSRPRFIECQVGGCHRVTYDLDATCCPSCRFAYQRVAEGADRES